MADHVPMKAPAHYLRVDLADAGEAEYWLVVLDAPRPLLEACRTLAAVRAGFERRGLVYEDWAQLGDAADGIELVPYRMFLSGLWAGAIE